MRVDDTLLVARVFPTRRDTLDYAERLYGGFVAATKLLETVEHDYGDVLMDRFRRRLEDAVNELEWDLEQRKGEQ